jgi:hypothetical protein
LRVHFTIGLTNPKREVAWIIQALDLTKETKGDGYAISKGSFRSKFIIIG